MATHNNCIYVFGGMDEERAEHMSLYRWDLSSDVGFELITYRFVSISGTASFLIWLTLYDACCIRQ